MNERETKLEQLAIEMVTRNLSDDWLDDAVHDAKAEEASAINNSGFIGQLEYLLNGVPLDKLDEKFEELVKE